MTLYVSKIGRFNLSHCEKSRRPVSHSITPLACARVHSCSLAVIDGNAVFPHPAIKFLPMPADESGRLGLVPGIPPQRFLDHQLFPGLVAVSCPAVRAGCAGALHALR